MVGLVLTVSVVATVASAQQVPVNSSSGTLVFAENVGQWNPEIRLQGRIGSTTVGFARHSIDYFHRVVRSGSDAERGEGYLLRTEFLGARGDVEVIGEKATGTRFNYYLGADATRQFTDARGFRRVRYAGLYDGIDLVYGDADGALKYEFDLAPGTDPATIRLRWSGARSVSVDTDGSLVIATPFGAMREARPVCYQRVDGRRVAVDGRFVTGSDDRVGFAVGPYDHSRALVIDPCLAVEYSTYFGGGNYDDVAAVAVDSSGNAIVSGTTRSVDFPTLPAQTFTEQTYAFVSKISPDGKTILYSTLVARPYNGPFSRNPSSGATMYEGIGEDVEVSGSGDAFVALTTTIPGLPTQAGVLQRSIAPNRSLGGQCPVPSRQNSDIYVLRLDPSGRIAWSTYLGGSDDDFLIDLALGSSGDVNLTGFTHAPACRRSGSDVEDAPTFPQTVTDGRFISGGDTRGLETFVTTLSSDGRQLRFSALFGGSGDDVPGAIAAGADGTLYVVGTTGSPDLPTTPGCIQPTAEAGIGGAVRDVYLARIDPNASTLDYSTYISDHGAGRTGLGFNGFVADTAALPAAFHSPQRRQDILLSTQPGVVVIGGTTQSRSMTTTGGAAQPTAPGGPTDAYVMTVDIGANRISAASYLGGSGEDDFGGITWAYDGEVVAALASSSSNFPITDATLQDHLLGAVDAVVVTLPLGLDRFVFSTYFGGRKGTDHNPYPEMTVAGITTASDGAMYFWGGTSTLDLPITDGALWNYNDFYGGYIVKFSRPESALLGTGASVTFDPDPCNGVQSRQQVVFNAGTLPLKIDDVRMVDGTHFHVAAGSLPLTVGSCESRTITIEYAPMGEVGCDDVLRDTLVISSSNATNRTVRVPLEGRTACADSFIPNTDINDPRFRLGHDNGYNFDVRAYATVSQSILVIADPSNDGVIVPSIGTDTVRLPNGITQLHFDVNASDTGMYCANFTAIVLPCGKTTPLHICSHVRTGIYRGPDTLDLGLISCGWQERTLPIYNAGNDTLELRMLANGGPDPFDAMITPTFEKPKKIPPGDSLLLTIEIRPRGVGVRRVELNFKTNEGFTERQYPHYVVRFELDSVAVRLATSAPSLVGGFGDRIEMPIEFIPVLDGRVPLSQFAFRVDYDRNLLVFDGVTTDSTLTAGWDVIEATEDDQGARVHLIRRDAGAPLTGSGILARLRFRVLRGADTATSISARLYEISSECLTAEIDSGWTFVLDTLCNTRNRLVVNGHPALKPVAPNPAGDRATIAWTMLSEGHVRITLHDLLGDRVRTIVDERRRAGDNAVSFDTHGLPAGRYFCRLSIDGRILDIRDVVISR